MDTRDVIELSRCNTSFGLDLFKKLAASNKGQNIFFSPYSIFSALAMTSLGAKNETLNQLRKVLKLEDIPESQTHKLYSEMNKSVMERRNKCILRMANRLYGEKSYNFARLFLENCKMFYGAELAAMDFNNNSCQCEKEINAWVANQTDDRILYLIPSGSLNFAKLVLVNAIYFKGEWINKFIQHRTEECDFHINANHSTKVQMMYMKEKLPYSFNEKLHCQILELPYDGNVSMFILLPDLNKTTLEKLENSLNPEDLNEFQSWYPEVNVWLPRFKVEEDFELSDVLVEMGAIDLFKNPDLSGMSEAEGISISKIIHKTFIKVDEEGSEAAAATAVEMFVTSCFNRLPPETVDFRADHPFLFLLRNNIMKTILFFGHLTNPFENLSLDHFYY